MRTAAVSLALCLADVSGVVQMSRGVDQGSKIVPKLENVASDKKFFGPPFPADYPDDMSPATGKDLNPKKRDAVYPRLAGGLSDNDFVHDENSDGGEWEAQMAYDSARVKYAKGHQLSEAAKERLRKETKEATDMKKKEREADAAEDAAEKEEKEAEKDEANAKESEEHLKDAAAKAAAEATKHADEIAKQNFTKAEIDKKVKESAEALKKVQEKFDKAEETYKKCKEDFAEKKGKLVGAQHINEALKAREAEITGNKSATEALAGEDFTDKLKAARAKAKAAEAQVKARKAEQDALIEKEKVLEAKAGEEKHEEASAEHAAEKAARDEAAAKKELDAAKQRLRNIRNPTPAPHSGATATASSVAVVLLAACVALLQ